ncbi:MAG: hypothetical protein JWO86_1234 [Myxococcaceae bacterium]|nr:hypothetical protein [Myxococcaceae bacterium]MEA2749646.1 hypothetical protein [Myxococcales bacterium]
MGRLFFGTGVAFATCVAACNMLSGADSLSSGPDAIEQPQTSGPPAPGPSSGPGGDGTSARPHDLPGTDGGVTTLPPDDGGIDAASEAAAQLPTFVDDFARTDGPIGNGWIEKTAGAFALSAGAVQQSQMGIYRNLFNSRPASEDALDVLVQVTVTFPVATADPGLFARIQPGSATTANHFVAYSVYADGANDLYVSRDDGNAFVDQGSSVISPPLVAGESYRLSLQVTGTNPVHLVGSLSKLDGTVLATITANDASAKKIATAGSVGFGSSVSVPGRWDDYKRITLAP